MTLSYLDTKPRQWPPPISLKHKRIKRIKKKEISGLGNIFIMDKGPLTLYKGTHR
jgi:hypothetical protein